MRWRALTASFWAQLALALVTISLVASALLGWVSYRSARSVLRQESIQAVAVLAAGREEALARLLANRRARAMTFLRTADMSCMRPRAARGDHRACFNELLQQFVATEAADGARL